MLRDVDSSRTFARDARRLEEVQRALPGLGVKAPQHGAGAHVVGGRERREVIGLVEAGEEVVPDPTPLTFFGYAASRVSLVLLGIIGYLAPVTTFVLGLAYFRERFPASQLTGYVLVWIALVIFTVDSRPARPARPAPGLAVPSCDDRRDVIAAAAPGESRPARRWTRR